MDCKNALVENEGEIEKAIDWLRKRICKANKKSSKLAVEGLVGTITENNLSCIIEVNSKLILFQKIVIFKNLLLLFYRLLLKRNIL